MYSEKSTSLIVRLKEASDAKLTILVLQRSVDVVRLKGNQ